MSAQNLLTNGLHSTDTLVIACGYCRGDLRLLGEDVAEYLDADEERRPSHLCPRCVETCRAHAKLDRQEREWIADGSPK